MPASRRLRLQQSLIRAAEAGDAELCRAALKHGARVDFEEYPFQGVGALRLAARYGHVDACTVLISARANVNLEQESTTALMAASARGHVEACRYLLSVGAQVNLASHSGFTPLMAAAENGHIEAFKLLIASRAFVDLRCTYSDGSGSGKTALTRAASRGHLDVCAVLISNHADVTKASKYSGCALTHAAEAGSADVCRVLLKAKCSVNGFSGDSHFRRTPLLKAARNGHADVCKHLLSAAADANSKYSIGRTAFDEAKNRGHTMVCKALMSSRTRLTLADAAWSGSLSRCKEILLKRKARKTTADIDDALNTAACQQRTDVCRLLIKARANLTSTSGTTAFRKVAGKGNVELCKIIRRGGMDVNRVERYEKSPLAAAAGHGHLDICKYLIHERADPNTQTWPALSCAAAQGHRNVCEYLLQCRAGINMRNEDIFADRTKTALMAAARGGHVDLCQYLVDARAELNAGALNAAASEGNFDACRFFVRFGMKHSRNKCTDFGEWTTHLTSFPVYFVHNGGSDCTVGNTYSWTKAKDCVDPKSRIISPPSFRVLGVYCDEEAAAAAAVHAQQDNAVRATDDASTRALVDPPDFWSYHNFRDECGPCWTYGRIPLLYSSAPHLDDTSYAHLVVGRVPQAGCDWPLGFGVAGAFANVSQAHTRALQSLEEHALLVLEDVDQIHASDKAFEGSFGSSVFYRDFGGGEGGSDKLTVSVERRAIQLPAWRFSFAGLDLVCKFPPPWPTGFALVVLFRSRRGSGRLPSLFCVLLLKMLACSDDGGEEVEQFKAKRRRGRM